MNTLDALKQVPLFESLLKDGKDCPAFVVDGREIQLQHEEWLVREGDPAAFYVLLEGRVEVIKRKGIDEVYLTTHLPGSFFGEIPLLLDTGFIAAGRADGPARVWKLEEDAFWAMVAACPSVTRKIMQTMADRMRALESVSQGHERLVSLGTLAAGLSHELNNPAAGARHAARELKASAADLPSLTCRLHKQVPGEAMEFVAELGRQVASHAGIDVSLTAMERADREDEIGAWLEDHGVEDGYELASNFVSADFDVEWLQCIADRLGDDALAVLVPWAASTLVLNSSAAAVDEATRRISELVGAVKTFSHLDQAPVGEVDIKAGIHSTVIMLGHKLKKYSLCKCIPDGLPKIWGHAGELNQVWTNILDNAADAVENVENGHIQIRVQALRDGVQVEIEDNGPGIAPEVSRRLFEPFYTTKGVGKGTGLGLATAYRIVHSRHHGSLTVDSRPGRTVFQIFLPVGKNNS